MIRNFTLEHRLVGRNRGHDSETCAQELIRCRKVRKPNQITDVFLVVLCLANDVVLFAYTIKEGDLQQRHECRDYDWGSYRSRISERKCQEPLEEKSELSAKANFSL